MKRFTLFSLVILYSSNAISREYHYSKPQTPFHSGGPNSLPSPGTTKHLIKTLGPNGRVYEVHTTPSQPVYEGVQPAHNRGVPGPATSYLAPTTGQQNYNRATPVTTVYVQHVYKGGAPASANSLQSYNTNPLTQHVNYAQPSAGYQAGSAGVSGGAYAQSGAYSNAGSSYAGQSSYSTSGSSYAGGSAAGARYAQPGASYIPPNGVSGGNAAAYYNQPTYSGAANLAGQISGYNNQASYSGAANLAGQISGHSNQASYANGGSAYASQPLGASASPGFNGNYISQSEGSALNVYPYQQENGDTRPFPRIVTTCDPSGRCQTRNLAPGEVDPTHQNFIALSRAHVQPVSEKCQRIRAAQQASRGAAQLSGHIAGAPAPSLNALYQPPNRPNDRRQFPYSEVVAGEDYN